MLTKKVFIEMLNDGDIFGNYITTDEHQYTEIEDPD